ncbi:hypothetical protein JST97_20930 [bacterium]|nr:hypothetical protein [bacterium]
MEYPGTFDPPTMGGHHVPLAIAGQGRPQMPNSNMIGVLVAGQKPKGMIHFVPQAEPSVVCSELQKFLEAQVESYQPPDGRTHSGHQG